MSIGKSFIEETTDLGNKVMKSAFKEFHGKASVTEENLRFGFVKVTDAELICSEYSDVIRLLYEDPDMSSEEVRVKAPSCSFYLEVDTSLLIAWNPHPRKRVYINSDGVSLISLVSPRELIWESTKDF